MKLLSKLSAVAVTGALAMASSGCGAQDPSDKPAADGTVTIDWQFWSQGEDGDKVWQDLADSVTDQYPDINVNLTTAPFADYFTKLQSQLAAGTTSCIVSMQSLRLPAFKDALVPVDEYSDALEFDEADWNAGALTALKVDNVQYAIPYDFSSMLMFYNKDAFKEAGIPEPTNDWTADDFVTAAKTITEKTGKPAFGQSFSDLHMFSQLLAFNGANPVTGDGSLDLTDVKMRDAVEWYASLATDENVASVPASSSDVPWGEQQLVAGNVAMAVDGSWNLSSNASDAAGFDMGVVALPQGPEGAGTFSANSGFGISKTCEHKEEAAKVIAALTNASAQETSAKGGSIPARTAATDAFYTSLETELDADNPGFSATAQAALERSFDSAVPFIPTGNWDAVTKLIAQQFPLTYSGDTAVEEALETVQTQGAK